ncbi:MAG: hypothetical protein MHMPM18_000748 [Marteilia pararefringens]
MMMSNFGGTNFYFKSDVVLENTLKLAEGHESNANRDVLQYVAEHEPARLERVRQEQVLQCKLEALQYAHRITVSEKRFKTLNESAEKLFRVMVDLALDIRAVNCLKEIMYQYRNMSTASSNPRAFIDIINQILQYVSNILPSLDVTKSMQIYGKSVSLMHMAFLEDQRAIDYLEHQELFNFCKETYKNILEVTRKLEKYENEYHKVAKDLISLSTKHNCKEEIKKICGILRKHINQIISEDQFTPKPSQSSKPINSKTVKNVSLNEPKTLQFNIETKSAVFQACTELSLWREAYFTLEEMQQLMSMQPILQLNAPKIWFDYLINISELCLSSQSLTRETLHIFTVHQKYAALALIKAFDILSRTQGPSQELKLQIAIKAYILTISISEKFSEDSENNEATPILLKNQRLSNLLKISPEVKISKSYLMKRLYANQLMNILPRELKEFANILSNPSSLLDNVSDLAERCDKLVESIPDNSIYLNRLKESVVVKSIQVVSLIYKNIDLQALEDLINLPTKGNTKKSLKLIINISNHSLIPIQIKQKSQNTSNLEDLEDLYEISWSIDKYRQKKLSSVSVIHNSSIFLPSMFVELDNLVNQIGLEEVKLKKNEIHVSLLNEYYNNINDHLASVRTNMMKIEQQEIDRLARIQEEEALQKSLAEQRQINLQKQHLAEAKNVEEMRKEEKIILAREALKIREAEQLLKDMSVLQKEIDPTIASSGNPMSAMQSFDKLNAIKFNKEAEKIEKQINAAKRADKNFDHISRVVTLKSLKLEHSSKDKDTDNSHSDCALQCHIEEVIKNANSRKVEQIKLIAEHNDQFKNIFENHSHIIEKLFTERQTKLSQDNRTYRDNLDELSRLEQNLENLKAESDKRKFEHDKKMTEFLQQSSNNGPEKNESNQSNNRSSYASFSSNRNVQSSIGSNNRNFNDRGPAVHNYEDNGNRSLQDSSNPYASFISSNPDASKSSGSENKGYIPRKFDISVGNLDKKPEINQASANVTSNLYQPRKYNL